jgi:hypothetical protein
MSEQGAGQPRIGPLYLKMSTPRFEDIDSGTSLPGAIDLFGQLSLSSQFKVSLHLVDAQIGDNVDTWLNQCGLTNSKSRNAKYDFYCAEATIPGAIFNTADESGSYQGITEKIPNKRLYNEFTITFYVDNDYKILRLFEEWMNYINPLYEAGGKINANPKGQGNAKESQNFFRFKYPNTYRRIISITKFERNFREKPGESGGKLGNIPTITYRMIDAYPVNISGIPVSYEGSTILKATVSFNYSRYVYEHNYGTFREVSSLQ